MVELDTLQEILDRADVEESVFALRPDYRVLLLAVDGIIPGPSGAFSDSLLGEAEAYARHALREGPVEEMPHVAAWRNAYRSFGAKPQRTRNSLEALMRRAEDGLPRVNRLTDLYNAISVLHQVPLGGEDLTRYVGSPRLIRATGAEDFDTTAAGETVIERPEPGEVVWRDGEAVTCRRWNWRQARRTRLTDTTTVLFILDALDPFTDAALHGAADHLTELLTQLEPKITIVHRLIRANGP
jgi:DNA/RNA-binding domain of Phe-tRNA-synthetase-like protein